MGPRRKRAKQRGYRLKAARQHSMLARRAALKKVAAAQPGTYVQVADAEAKKRTQDGTQASAAAAEKRRREVNRRGTRHSSTSSGMPAAAGSRAQLGDNFSGVTFR